MDVYPQLSFCCMCVCVLESSIHVEMKRPFTFSSFVSPDDSFLVGLLNDRRMDRRHFLPESEKLSGELFDAHIVMCSVYLVMFTGMYVFTFCMH